MSVPPTSLNKAQIAQGRLDPTHIVELVKFWQQHHDGLVVDGAAGPRTIASITATLPGPHLELPAGRAWPLRSIKGRAPEITSAYYARNPSRNTAEHKHRGVDVMFTYTEAEFLAIPEHERPTIGDGGAVRGHGDAIHAVPRGTFADAAGDGVVVLAGPSPTGFRVWIDHGGGLHTGTFHLTAICVEVGQTVRLGDPIGIVGDNPRDHDPAHVHFELYRGDLAHYPIGSLDPELWLDGAQVLEA